jgi:hypothetical protein
MYFDLDSIMHEESKLEILHEPFSTKEIDAIVSNLPSGKSPSPDGFNSDFLKKCWTIISGKFYELYHGFFNSDICLQSINGLYIVLVPKVDNPSYVGNFRQISLLNFSIKLITSNPTSKGNLQGNSSKSIWLHQE